MRKECRAKIEMDVSALWNLGKKWNQEERINRRHLSFFHSNIILRRICCNTIYKIIT